MKVAILGCGPTGLIAAYAAESKGHDVTIISRKQKSQTFGAMYLHAPIPDVSPKDPELEIQVVKMGTREGYARNVYGNPKAEVSWDKFKDGPTPGWDLAAAYSKLWLKYDSKIEDRTVTSRNIREVIAEYDKVFSTVPARYLCDLWLHEFRYIDIWVLHGPLGSEYSPWNVMYYNGIPDSGLGNWYRYSVIRGYQSWEYAMTEIPPYAEGHRLPDHLKGIAGIKPLGTNCNCHPEVTRLGRFGKWEKNAFTHHAWSEVRDAL